MKAAIQLHVSVIVLGVSVLFISPASAAKHGCEKCGCHKTKKVLKLVRTWEEVATPIYQCNDQEVFCPQKAIACQREYRCDNIYKLHQCCSGHCGCTGTGTITTRCSCETDCGCKTLYGASPHGCFKTCHIKSPSGENCVRKVPVVKWIAMEACPECGSCTETETQHASITPGLVRAVSSDVPVR